MNLTMQQQNFLKSLISNGVCLLKGGAGTGKTFCAVDYTLQMGQKKDDFFETASTVGFLTYTRSLIGKVKKVVDATLQQAAYRHLTTTWNDNSLSLFSSQQNRRWEMCVNTIDSLVYQMVKPELKARELNTRIYETQLLLFIEQAKAAVFSLEDDSKLAQKPNEFFLEEILWIKGCEITSLEAYQKVQRIGRGSVGRITLENRTKLWEVYTHYQQILEANKYWDYLDRQAYLLRDLPAGNQKPFFIHLTIDEAQDCAQLTLKLLNALVCPGGTVLLVADVAQKIYRNSFSWKSVGFTIKGRNRSFCFDTNFRNTFQIKKLGDAILVWETSSIQEEFTPANDPLVEGEVPKVYQADHLHNVDHLACTLKTIDSGASCAVAVHTEKELQLLQKDLLQRGVAAMDVRTKMRRQQSGIFISTFHSLKGLEFKHVYLMNLDDKNFPLVNTEEENSKRRRLLHTAVTRACKTVTIYSDGVLTPYLQHISEAYLKLEHEIPC